jgi:heme a synthase
VAQSATRGFHRLVFSTLVAVYLLIAVGAIVRATGSGMGCPDWPRCFGKWVPPASVEQLPADYKEQVSALRHKKNQKFARYLAALGMNETADRLMNDESILMEADFNMQKTWIEYINRLVGVVIGLFIIALFVKAVPVYKTNPLIFWVSLATLVTVIFQGWFGSIVVSTNLTPWTITIHMFLALVIVALLIVLYTYSGSSLPLDASNNTILLLAACMVILLIQIFLGTEVRGAVDRLSQTAEPRANWIAMIGGNFIIHRSFSWVVVLLHLLLIRNLKRSVPGASFLASTMLMLILATVLAGVGMAYFAFPAFLQPLHLLVAAAAFGAQFYLFLLFTGKRTKATIRI